MKKKLSLLGCGGHGWENCSELILNWQKEVYLWFETTDWGGFTGVWGRMLEDNFSKTNITLHIKPVPVFPWGDINKAVGFFMGRKNENIKNLWLNRCNTYEEIKQNWQNFKKFFEINSEMEESFIKYLLTAWQELENFKKNNKIDSRPPSLAHFFSPWLLCFFSLKENASNNSMKNWNNWWKEQKILPNYIYQIGRAHV